jgi:guanylate kinase
MNLTRRKVVMDPFTSVAGSNRHNSGDDSNKENKDNLILDPLIVCGPSGVGKGTIIQKFMDELGGKNMFGFTVSHTTRQPREGEINGVHYHFASLDDMKRDIEEGLFLEHAIVHGNYYGTSFNSLEVVQKAGRRCLLDIDVQGVMRVKAMASAAATRSEDDDDDDDDTTSSLRLQPKYLFIAPPSLEILEKRLIGRGTETPEALARRTANAKAEVAYGQQQGQFDAIVVNEDLDRAVFDFAAAVSKLYGIEL